MPSEEEVDEMFHVLSNSRRRYVIHVLNDRDRIDKGELSTRVTELEHGSPIEDLDKGSDRHTVHVSLHQTHLDVLEDANAISRNGSTIMKGAKFAKIYRFLEPERSFSSRIKQSVSVLGD